MGPRRFYYIFFFKTIIGEIYKKNVRSSHNIGDYEI